MKSEAERAEEAGKRGDNKDFVRDHQKAKWEIPEYV